MLADMENIFSDKQSLVTGGAGTLVGSNIMDLRAVGTIPQGGSPIADYGRRYGYRPPDLMFQITTAVTGTGSTTVDFQVCNSANEDLSSPNVIDASGAIAKATLVAGYQPRVGRNLHGMAAADRYLGTNYVVAVSDVLTGAVWAGVASTRQTTPYVAQ
jgi:hypothetical protein